MKIVAKDTKFLLINLRGSSFTKNIISYNNFVEIIPSFFIISKYAFSDKNDPFYKISLKQYMEKIIENSIYIEKLYLKQKLENNLTIKNKEKRSKI